jgi:hypothetical protein
MGEVLGLGALLGIIALDALILWRFVSLFE